MIFNLNEQKVLSDPSGSSVFKGEKDFNDIVVNLPNNIDGHTATELNYVMHFVDSDGGYSTKILTVDSSGETLKATATVSTNITSKAQAFYAYVLMTDDEETVIGKTNGVIVMIHPVPDEENEIIPPADADKIIKGLEEIVKEATETIETATDTIEEATEAISSKQDKLTAGENITISSGNVISAEGGGVTSYNDLTDKPKLYLRVGDSSPSIEPTEVDISNVFRFLWNEIYLTRSENGYAVNFNIPFNGLAENKKYFHSQTEWNKYNFNSLSTRQKNGIWDLNVQKCLNTPQFIIDCFVGIYNLNFFIMHFLTDYYVIRVVAGEDVNNDLRIFSQYLTTNPTTGAVTSQTDWVELTGGGSQIVSGVVNANGTITFTDSDGNTFTTSGSSVIGPQGDDYVLTAQDKSDIADIVLSELPTTQGVLYGNTSN